MTLNGLETPKHCKTNLFYFRFSIFIIFSFFVFRIIFERTSYGTTVYDTSLALLMEQCKYVKPNVSMVAQ